MSKPRRSESTPLEYNEHKSAEDTRIFKAERQIVEDIHPESLEQCEDGCFEAESSDEISKYIDQWQLDWAKMSSQKKPKDTVLGSIGFKKASQPDCLAGLDLHDHWSSLGADGTVNKTN